MIKGMFYVDDGIESSYAQEVYLQGAIKTLFKNENEDSVSARFISAAGGDSCAYALAETYRRDNDTHIIITNCSPLFSFHKFIWDKERGCYNLWFWKEEELEEGYFAHVTELTQKDLREAHNIWRMWHNGAFDIYRAWGDDPEA